MPTKDSENKSAKTASMSSKKVSGFSSISDLIERSIARVKATWSRLLVLYIITVVAVMFLVGMIVASVIGGAASTALTSGTLAPQAFLVGGGLVVVAVLAIVLIGSVSSVAMLIAVSEDKEKSSIGAIISKALSLFLPVFLTSLIVMFLVWGGVMLFIIPGIVIAILTAFATYEIVFSDVKYLSAIKRSVSIISQNFGELFARYILLIVASILISMIPEVLGGANNTGASALAGLLSMVLQAVVSLFSLAYMYELYAEAKAQTDFSKQPNMVWMWIVAFIGWVIMAGLIVFGVRALSSAMSSGQLQEFMEELESGDFDSSGTMDYDYQLDYTEESSGEEFDTEAFIDQFGSEMTEEEKEQFRQSIERTEQMMQQDEAASEQEQQ